jgi:hypothetical protein
MQRIQPAQPQLQPAQPQPVQRILPAQLQPDQPQPMQSVRPMQPAGPIQHQQERGKPGELRRRLAPLDESLQQEEMNP